MAETDIQKKHFESISADYIKARTDKKHLAYKDTLWKYILDKLSVCMDTNKPVLGLEAMAGYAEASGIITGAFPMTQMHAFDYSETMVQRARQTAGKSVSVYRGDMLELNSPGKYDFAVLIGGLHHIPNSAGIAVKNIYDSLKPGGIFLNMEPTHNNILLRKIRESIYRGSEFFEESSERGFTLAEYNSLFKGAGFSVLYQFYPGLLGYVMHYNPDAFPMLNIGTRCTARALSRLDILLGRTFVGRYLSFTTCTIAGKGQ